MKGFLQVVSLFGLPLAVVIWYDLYSNSGAYMQTYGSEASRYVALGIYLVTAFLCLHLPLRLWRRFDAMSLRVFCLTGALVTFWVAVRLATSGRLGDVAAMKSLLVFLIPVAIYPLLSHFLFKWSRAEFDGAVDADPAVSGAETPTPTRDDEDEHGDP